MSVVEDLLRYLFSSGERRWPAESGARAELLGLAAELELEGALYAALRKRGHVDLLPAWQVEPLRRTHTENATRSMAVLQSTEEIRAALRERGVSMGVLKGTSLLETGVLENMGSRYLLDIDLLTHLGDRETVIDVMTKLGYQRSEIGDPVKHLPAFTRGWMMVEVHEYAFWDSRGRRWELADLQAEADPLAFTVAHLVHHLHVSSILDGPLAAKTLADMVTIRDHFARHSAIAARTRSLAEGAGVLRELEDLMAACEALVEDRALSATEHAVVELCATPSPRTVFARELDFYRKNLVHAPAWLRRRLIKSIAAPSRRTLESIYGLERGSWLSGPAYLLHPFRAIFRVGRRIGRALL